MPFMSSEIEMSPRMSEMFESFDKMPSPRIFKSHLPFYLLHPELLDTCKVNFTFHLFY
jgi:hypothetical protein